MALLNTAFDEEARKLATIARHYSYDQKPEQFLIDRLKTIDIQLENAQKLDDLVEQKNVSTMLNRDKHLHLLAIDFIKQEDTIKETVKHFALQSYKLDYLALRATCESRVIYEKLIADKETYQNASIFNFLHKEPTGIKILDEGIDEILDFIRTELQLLGDNFTEQKQAPPPKHVPKPMIKENQLDTFIDVIEQYFDPQIKDELRSALQSGIKPKQKLLFQGEGNKLAHAFRTLFDAQLLTGCNKKQLQDWIQNSFKYLDKQRQPKDFKLKYLEDIISGDKPPALPLNFIVNKQGEIEKRTK